MRRVVAATLSATVAAGLLATGAASANPLDVRFAIVRNGERIGTHTIKVDGTPVHRTVESTVEIVVKIAFVPFYRKKEVKRETLDNDRLASYEATDTTNGTTTHMTARLVHGKIEISGPEGNFTGPPDLLPETYWNVDIVTRDKTMDSTTGEIVSIAVEKLGWETVQDPSGGGKKVKALHYRMTGGFERDLWYDSNGRWVGMSLTASDGSKIVYQPAGQRGEGD